MLGIIKWLNPAYPIMKLLSPVARRPEKVLAIAGKPVASASAALMARNQESITIPITGDASGEVIITTPYDQETLEKMLAISLLPQVALLTTAYAIPELQRDLNILWRSATLGRAGNLPRWNLTRDMMGRRIKQEVFETTATKATAAAIAKGATPKVAAGIGARAAGSFVAGVNVVIWIDTAILALTGILDLLISEEDEEAFGIDLQPFSPLGDVINSMMGFVADKLGIGTDEIVKVGQALGLEPLAKGGLFMLGDLVLDYEKTTIDVNLEFEMQSINLDLDGRTFGEVMGLALQFASVDEATKIGWDDPTELLDLFFITLLSLLLIAFGGRLLRSFRSLFARS